MNIRRLSLIVVEIRKLGIGEENDIFIFVYFEYEVLIGFSSGIVGF